MMTKKKKERKQMKTNKWCAKGVRVDAKISFE